MRLEHAHQSINRITPRRGNVRRVIHPVARILQQSRHVGNRRAVRVPVERGLALESRAVRQGGRVDDLGLIRHVADRPIPIFRPSITISGKRTNGRSDE